MKLWKVYARCCVSAHPIEEVESVEPFIGELFDDAALDGRIEFTEENLDEVISAYFEEKKKQFDEKGYLGCGDFEIVRLPDDEYPTRPNKCNFDY